MVASTETILESRLCGKRRSTSISSTTSVVNFTDHGSRTTDQQFGSSDDLPIDQCSLVFERSARNRNCDPSLGRWINQDPAGYINGGNTYQFLESNPVNAVDPWGLAAGATAPPPVEPWVMPYESQGGDWVPFTPRELIPKEPPPATGGGGFFAGLADALGDINPWSALAPPLFDTPPAGGEGDTLHAP